MSGCVNNIPSFLYKFELLGKIGVFDKRDKTPSMTESMRFKLSEFKIWRLLITKPLNPSRPSYHSYDVVLKLCPWSLMPTFWNTKNISRIITMKGKF